MTKRIYIAGPITGMPELNYPAFHAEARRLRDLGYDAVSPIELNHAPNATWHQFMRHDLRALLTCDAMALLEGWQNSAGANGEIHVARLAGIEILIAKEITS